MICERPAQAQRRARARNGRGGQGREGQGRAAGSRTGRACRSSRAADGPGACITSFFSLQARVRMSAVSPSAPATRPLRRGSRTTFCLSRLLQMRDVAQAHKGASQVLEIGRWALMQCTSARHGNLRHPAAPSIVIRRSSLRCWLYCLSTLSNPAPPTVAAGRLFERRGQTCRACCRPVARRPRRGRVRVRACVEYIYVRVWMGSRKGDDYRNLGGPSECMIEWMDESGQTTTRGSCAAPSPSKPT